MNDERQTSVATVFLAFLRLGLTSFGGPVAHIGYFHDEFVVRRRWLDERAYADLVALCQFLPGPASSQVGIGIGLSRAGLPGATILIRGLSRNRDGRCAERHFWRADLPGGDFRIVVSAGYRSHAVLGRVTPRRHGTERITGRQRGCSWITARGTWRLGAACRVDVVDPQGSLQLSIKSVERFS